MGDFAIVHESRPFVCSPLFFGFCRRGDAIQSVTHREHLLRPSSHHFRAKLLLDSAACVRTYPLRPYNHATLALTPGTRLGVYEVTAQIGEGGMGQVYRATDTTLGRQVAIKILPDAFAADPERLARFEREAKTLASLNHPHIAAIYGVREIRRRCTPS